MLWALEDMEPFAGQRRVVIPTGECGFEFLNKMLDGLRKKCDNIRIDLIPVRNQFFGGTVNVTGLLTGQDICAQLADRPLGGELLIAGNMLRAGEDIFLDDMTLEELSRRLGLPARRVGGSGEDLLCAILGREQPAHTGYNP